MLANTYQYTPSIGPDMLYYERFAHRVRTAQSTNISGDEKHPLFFSGSKYLL